AREGFLASSRIGALQWTNRGNTTATIAIMGGHNEITLDYRVRSGGDDWESIKQRVPICWKPCRFGGERPWFVCNVWANGVHCGRRVAKLYGVGRLFACRHCYHLGYAVQRGGPMDCAHHRLACLHRKLDADYDGPDRIPPPKPKWMRWKTYSRIASQIEAGEEHLDHVFTVGALRIIARADRSR
ncbi:MAG TPA: hypothetical protein VFE56_05625, partial [Candidatus Binataceae bacterium]|nr:hypothetical protein [Candidatus Binataceae bacterium]